ncbi:DUF2933 domain-containing protein [Methylocystis echinoides]|uniref:DUF2933 domain-containing protein n=1 Tax=Methylocystis echinoides TaxID=29468 RepID=A0A9W6LU35_9HYPH|nr:DUF2933 domain-containing protein [Methylocystis echinoides]RTL86003.1 MAG: DUF2933 domain-containing protein [Hyphomicrobiales bacterium]GLI95137.1 hypothetical protein LMG27198_41290 [Methylocystis echinoides]
MRHEHQIQNVSSDHPKAGFFTDRGKIVLIGFLAIVGFYLLTEHTAHLFGVLPYLLLFACPLMHIFMHGGHGSHGGHQSERNEDAVSRDEPPHQR